MKKLLSLILIIMLIVSLMSGCDFKDIDRRVFIVAIGIDAESSNPELMRVSFKAAMPTSGGESGGGGSSSEKDLSDIYTITGDSLSNIFRKVKSETSMEPDFAHMKLILFGEQFVKVHDIGKILDFFARRRDFQNIAYIALGTPSAKKILSTTPKEERIPGNSLFMKFGQGSESPYAYKKRLFEMYGDTITPGCSPTCSIMEIKEDKIAMNKVAVFSEGKLALELGPEETQILNLLTERVQLGSLSTKLEGKGKPVSISINQGSSKIKVSKNSDGDIICTIKPKIDATLEELDDFVGEANELAPTFEETLKKQTMALIDKLKENKVDPIRIQMFYWASDKNYMPTQKWLTDIYSNVKFVVEPEIRLDYTGILGSD